MRVPRSVGVPAIAGVTWIVAIMSVAAYYLPEAGFRYGTPIDWPHLLRLLPDVRPRQVVEVLSRWDLAFWVSLIAWGALVHGGKSERRSWVAVAVPLVLLFPLNLLGLVALFMDLSAPGALDGELLSEHWPVLHVYGAWTFASVSVAAGRAWSMRRACHRPRATALS